MLNELKKKTVTSMLPLLIILMLIGGFLDVVFAKQGIAQITRKDISAAKISQIQKAKEATIEIDKYNLWGVFLDEYETSDGKQKVTAYYLQVLVGDDEDARYMAVKVDAKYESKIDKIVEEYTDLDNGIDSDERTVIKAKGSVSKMTDEEYGYFKEYLEEQGFEEDEIPFYTLNRCLNGTEHDNGIAMMIIGTILVVIAIVFLVLGISGAGVKKLNKKLETMGVGAASAAETDFMSATKIGKNGRLYIGRRFTYYTRALKADIIENDKIVWVYTKRVRHRTNGIPTGSTYSVIIYPISKKAYEIPLRNEYECTQAVDTFEKVSDRIVLGYSDELMKMFNKDFNNFLAIAYNKPVDNGYYAYGNDNQDNSYNQYGNDGQNNGYNPYGNAGQNNGYNPYGNDSQNNGYNPYGNSSQNSTDAFGGFGQFGGVDENRKDD